MKTTITKFLRYGTLISTIGLIGSVLIQILARFLLPNAPAWTEEASRLFFIYAVAFSAGLAFDSKDYVALDGLFEPFFQKWGPYIFPLISVLVVFLFLTMTFYAFPFVFKGHFEFSPGMKIRMSYVFFSMVILAGSLSYFVGGDLIEQLKNRKS